MELIKDIILSTADSIIAFVLFLSLTQQKGFIKKNVAKSIVFIFLYTLIINLTELIIPQGVKPLFNLIFAALMLSIITRTSMIPSFIASAVIFVFLFTIEGLVLLVMMMILRMDIETITGTFLTETICGAVSKTLEILLATIIMKSRFRIKRLSQLKEANTLFQLMALQTLMIAVLILSISFVRSYETHKFIYNIFIIVVYLLCLVLYYFDYKERERLQAIQNRFKVQEEYIKNIENILSIVRREKHDFSNHLNTILAMCTLNKPDSLQKIANYIKKLSAKHINTYHIYNTGNDYVDSMLAVKSNLAFEQGIELEAYFDISLKELDISDCDITSILANITDNALEAIASGQESEGKKISLVSFEDSGDYCISISNNGPAIPEKEIGKIFSSGYTTKKNDKSDHGFGLYIVQQMVQRNNGTITVTSTDEKTEFLIRFARRGRINGKVS